MRLGVSTACLYPDLLEHSLDLLIERGFKLFEVFVNTFSELEPKYLDDLRGRVQKSGAEICSLHPFTSAFEVTLFFSEYERRTQDGLKFYRQYFEAANRIGAHILVLHGQRNYQKSRISPEQYLESYHRLYCLGQEYGVTVAQENVVQFRSEQSAFIRRMRKELGKECAFVLDLKQAVRAGENPMQMLDAMGERLVHVHLNDHTSEKDCLLPGSGSFDFSSLAQKLEEMKYSGNGVIEVYRDNFGKPEELVQAYRFLSGIFLQK